MTFEISVGISFFSLFIFSYVKTMAKLLNGSRWFLE